MSLKQRALHLLQRAEGWLDSAFTPALNPVHHLGALSFFYFWVVTVTGIYLFIVFETSVHGAYQSVEYLTHQQWYLGGVMRSLHRYASDALIVVMMLHLVREWLLGRFTGARWFTWVTGVPLIWFAFAAGIGGYWLVWDRLAQYIAVTTAEWFDQLGIFGEPIARNFIAADTLSDRFFTLLVFLHIFLPLTMLFLLWIHLQRLSRPEINPPKALAGGTLAMLLALSFWKPALSQGPVDLQAVPAVVDLDWFYLGFYPLIEEWSKGAVWAFLFGATVLLMALPWLGRRRRPAPAVVTLANCNGCQRCVADCPFAAVRMAPRSDGKAVPLEAVVDPDLCVACGICVGACPSATPFRRVDDLITGIDLPEAPLTALRREVVEAMARLKGPARVIVFGCDQAVDVRALGGNGVATFSLACISQLPPSFVDFILSRGGADGVMITGCREGDCFHRLGVAWMKQRLAGERDPYLRTRVSRARIATFWGAPPEAAALRRELGAFRERLAERGDAEEGPIGGPAEEPEPERAAAGGGRA